MSNKVSAEKAREMFLAAVESSVDYWATVQAENIVTARDRLEGLAFSLLCILDGASGSMPCAIDLVLRPNPLDKLDAIDQGDDWLEDGMCINAGIHLHDELTAKYRKRTS